MIIISVNYQFLQIKSKFIPIIHFGALFDGHKDISL